MTRKLATVAGSCTRATGAAGVCQVRVPALRPVIVAPPIYTAPGGIMADERQAAEQFAAALAASQRARIAPGTPDYLRPTIYIIEGCPCVQQDGQYHVHIFDPRALTYWRETYPDLQIIAAYPV